MEYTARFLIYLDIYKMEVKIKKKKLIKITLSFYLRQFIYHFMRRVILHFMV